MKFLAPVLFIILGYSLGAQEITTPDSTSNTYAVVVGISEHQNEDIPDLKFADKDAEAFANYLRSPAGGNLSEDNIRLLTNEKATFAAVAAELDWLVEVCQEDDQAIFYFSGHGDVEAKTERQPGFLLTYDSPSKVYISGSYPLFYLQLIIETLSTDKNVQTLVITDACRAGKLAGSEIGGTQATAANLAKQYANEIKILSCQPDEFSLEGEQWGGGRGAFSYHLIEGLIGLADKNGDAKVNLLDSKDGQPSADELYRQLIQLEELQSLKSSMTRKFSVALQDDAQQAINSYMLANPTELKKRWKADSTYSQYPRYLGRAAELLGEKHYMYDFMIAKQLYFEGLNLRLKADAGNKLGSYEEAIEKQQAALALENRAAFLYNELGVIYTRLINNKKAVENYGKAIELAPEWGLPYINYCLELFYSGDKEKAIDYGEKALSLLPDYPQLMNLLGWIYWDRSDESNLRDRFQRSGIELKDDFIYAPDNVLTSTEKKLRYQKVIELLEQAVAADPEFVSGHLNLGMSYLHTQQHKKAIDQIKKALQLDSTTHTIYTRLGDAYSSTGQYAASVQAYTKAIALVDSTQFWTKSNWYLNMGITYGEWGKPKEALATFLKAIELAPNNEYANARAADIYYNIGQLDKAERYYIRSISFRDYPQLFQATGWFYEQLNRFEEAEWMYLKAIKVFPNFVIANNNLTGLYFKTRQLEKAMKHAQNLIELNPDYSSYINAGKAAYLTKQPDRAKEYFQQAIDLAPADPSTLLEIGYFFFLHSEYQKAEEYLKKALEIDPQSGQVHDILANNRFMNGHFTEAIAWLDKGLALNPTPIGKANLFLTKDFIIYLAKRHKGEVIHTLQAEKEHPPFRGVSTLFEKLRDEDWTTAGMVLHELLKSFPDLPGGNYIQCRLKIKGGELEEALPALEKAVKSIPFDFIQKDPELAPLRQVRGYQQIMREYFPEKFDDLETFHFSEKKPIYYPENCVSLAKYYERQNEKDRAMFLYEKATELHTDSLSATEQLAIAEAYLKLGDYEKAKEVCPEEVEVEETEKLLPIGKLLYLLDRPEQAEVYFQKAIKVSTNKQLAQKIGWHYQTHGEKELAIKYLRKALEIYPEFHGPFWDLGWLYFSLGEYEKAAMVMDEGIEKYPNEFDLKGIKEMILCLSNPFAQAGKAFEKLEVQRPGIKIIDTYLDLVRENKYKEASDLREEINESFSEWWIKRMLRVTDVWMFTNKGAYEDATAVQGCNDATV